MFGRFAVGIALVALAPALPARSDTASAAALTDDAPDAAAFQGAGSGRLAAPVSLRFDGQFIGAVTVESNGGKSAGTTDAAANALRKYSLNVSRRHFEDAKWSTASGKGNELVIKSVAVTFYQGPSYTVRVTVERVQDGRRLGQAMGSGTASADRSTQRAKAAWAPGPWAMNAATAARPDQDAPTIEVAAIRGLDSALQQASAYWYGEQRVEEAQRKAQEARYASQKHRTAKN
jgi:hypothetical protein